MLDLDMDPLVDGRETIDASSKIKSCGNNLPKLKSCPSYYPKSNLRLKMKLVISFAILLNIVTFLCHKSLFCHSTLLTNIYGKKLSEITDIAHRFLIVPSPLAHKTDDFTQRTIDLGGTNSNFNSNIDMNDMNSPTNTQQNYVAEDLNEQNDQSRKNLPGDELSSGARISRDLGKSDTNTNGAVPAAATAAAPEDDKEPLPIASPLMAAWRQQHQQLPQQQQQQQYNKAKLMLQTNGSTSGQTQGAADAIRVAGEPSVAETMSTEFPNPNINNLGHEITKILRKFFQHGYDKRVRPNYSGPPALVNVSFHIIGISSVDEVQMDFTTDFYFRQKWYDPRLEFDPVGEVDELCVGAEFAEKIWLPDTFFANEKTATFHKATTENTFIRIADSGRVYRSIRLTVTCSCPMDLQYFPMDRQRCKIEIESYGYNTRDIDYRWERGDQSVTLNTKIELPQFKILGFKMGQELQNLSSGDYIRLYCEIHFVRSMGYYLIQIYIPASLIVMISWVSFWLHRNATPARVALGVTTVLTMTTLMSSTNAALPKISYIKSIDVFLGTCFVMVFASLLEYASVGYIGKRIAMKRKRLQDLQQMQQHHQKVCVAAAASAAAAAAAAQESNPIGVASRLGGGANHATSFFNKSNEAADKQNDDFVSFDGNGHQLGDSSHQHASGSQTLRRGTTSAKLLNSNIGSKTLQRNTMGHTSSSNGPYSGSKDANDNKKSPNNPMTSMHRPGNQPVGGVQPIVDPNNRAPLLAAGAAIAAAAAANQPSHGATTEFEVSQTHDLIRICGLTPSAIDKHSRVVFPICFVCFNLMYWIIYGHISQQIEDKGPPLIPFIKA